MLYDIAEIGLLENELHARFDIEGDQVVIDETVGKPEFIHVIKTQGIRVTLDDGQIKYFKPEHGTQFLWAAMRAFSTYPMVCNAVDELAQITERFKALRREPTGGRHSAPPSVA